MKAPTRGNRDQGERERLRRSCGGVQGKSAHDARRSRREQATKGAHHHGQRQRRLNACYIAASTTSILVTASLAPLKTYK